MSSSLLAYAEALIIVKKRKLESERNQLLNQLKFLDDVPEELMTKVFRDEDDFRNYVFRNDTYSEESFTVARQFIDDLQPGHKHHDIHCISFTASLKSLIGIVLKHFAISSWINSKNIIP